MNMGEKSTSSWALAISLVLPGLILATKFDSGEELPDFFGFSYGSIGSNILNIMFEFFVMGQLVLGPATCAVLARKMQLSAAIFVAMGSPIVLLISNQVIVDLANLYNVIAVFTCTACLVPFIMVLRNKRTQLPAGRARHTWAALISVSTLMFASATMVVAIQNMESPQIDDNLAWSSLVLVAGAIGWAWPKGAKIIEDFTEEIIEKIS